MISLLPLLPSRPASTPRRLRSRMAVINHAAMHPNELRAAIAAADVDTLAQIDADLAREGWSLGGVMRQTIAKRKAELTG